ncbi:MAG TPA: L,D-transpeptidase family protein [Novosphingobium sp.]|nr:L,D-transpeptidase family protein [Novosphingobium sp.]
MRGSPIASSLLAVALMLSACDFKWIGGEKKGSSVELEQIHWSRATARQLRGAIDRRSKHGLDRLQFEGDKARGDDEALTEAALAYANALARGASDPAKLYKIYTLPRPQPDLRRGLAEAVKARKVDQWLESLAPQDSGYRTLSRTYLTLREKGRTASAALPATGEPLKPDGTDPRVPAIARQLVSFNYLDEASAQGDRYTPAMAAAVQRMQIDYGIKPDGIIGGDTLTLLNLTDADRARAIAVDMERMRWLERRPPPTRIDVNIAAATLTYWRGGQIADVRKVVVGKPDSATPQLGSAVFRLVANPTWTVPRSIEREEIAGKGEGYMRRNNMVWKDGRIVQESGPDNSLGLVKFDMENPYAIYLHDTPVKPLFAEVQRQRSHGCVRVEDALGFAEVLARDTGVLDQWHRAQAAGKEAFVPLAREIPVRLLYQTVAFGPDGEPMLREDPYGWNDPIAAKLGFPASTSRPVQVSPRDLGP